MLDRANAINAVKERRTPWDILVIGGGATGLGVAVDAASRGCDVLLLEQSDFAKGASSRSTKLIHGGVRYLQQGNVSLVMDALRERGRLRHNAPHLVDDLAFIVPSYAWWESPFYGIGMKGYDLLAGRYGFGRSSSISREEVIEAIPGIRQEGLRGGTRYFDGQFDDARLAIALALTAAEHGATLINYMSVTGLIKSRSGEVIGVRATDAESGDTQEARGKVIVNATGPFSDQVRALDDPEAEPIIAPSQGTHLVLDRSFLAGAAAIMVPHTADDRVMFAIPWQGVVVVGTTDTAIEQVVLEPRPRPGELEYLLDTANRYLARPATLQDALSIFTGVRPLVRSRESGRTASLSRDHTILIDPVSGLLTIAGGKWTTYRKMAEDVVDHAAVLGDLEATECVTENLPLHGHSEGSGPGGRFARYGSDAQRLEAWCTSAPEMDEKVHAELSLTVGEVRWFCRHEMARTVDDVLARRSRSLVLNARASIEAAPRVAALLAEELGRSAGWAEEQVALYRDLAQGCLPTSCP